MIVACLHHLDQPFLGHAARPLRAAGMTLDERCVVAGEPLPALGEVDGIVSFGGSQSAVGPTIEPALEAEVAFLREAVEAGLPVLGICLGGQLLSRALGGTVTRARRRTVTWRGLVAQPGVEDPLVAALPPTVPALHWNEDVFSLPPGAVELLGPRVEGVEAFRHGPRAWGLQFHPEVDAAAVDRWYARYGPWLGEAGVDEASARALDAEWLPRQAEASERLFGAFAAQVAQREGASAGAVAPASAGGGSGTAAGDVRAARTASTVKTASASHTSAKPARRESGIASP